LLSLLYNTYRSLRCCFFIYPSTTQIYTLSLHDALPISADCPKLGGTIVTTQIPQQLSYRTFPVAFAGSDDRQLIGSCIIFKIGIDRKSTRLNSSHVKISYAVFCLKKKKPL